MRNLPRLASKFPGAVRCVITSPPYFDVTNYAEDQWLRLWFLGGAPFLEPTSFSKDARHGRIDKYWGLLADMWRSLGLVLAPKGQVVIRVGATRIPPARLVSGIEGVAAVANRKVKLISHEVSEIKKRQTDSFRPGSAGCKIEVDCHFEMR